MRAFVESEIRKLVNLAFAGQPNVGHLSARMAEKLMTDETAQSLEPLRQTLQLSGEEYREGIFAWKGFLYYSWSVTEFAPKLADLSRQILSIRLLRRKVVRLLGVASHKVRDGIRQYNNAYQQLAAGQPRAFRTFLIDAPSLFLSVGDAVSIIKHIDSYWRFRFKTTRKDIDVEDARDIFQEFSNQLAGVEAAAEAPAR